MGLDIVEFVMDVENVFGVTIPDREAGGLATPRMLIDWLHARLPQGGETHCPTQRAFHAVRRALVERQQVSRSVVRPRARVEVALPDRNPGTVWAEVGRALGYDRWARLSGSYWQRWFSGSIPRTFGDGAREIATHAPRSLKQPGEGWSWHEISWVVVRLMREHFALGDFRLDDSFVDDLGLD